MDLGARAVSIDETEIDTAIENAVSGPKAYRTDGESAESHSLKDLLDAKDRVAADSAMKPASRRNTIQSLFFKLRPVN